MFNGIKPEFYPSFLPQLLYIMSSVSLLVGWDAADLVEGLSMEHGVHLSRKAE